NTPIPMKIGFWFKVNHVPILFAVESNELKTSAVWLFCPSLITCSSSFSSLDFGSLYPLLLYVAIIYNYFVEQKYDFYSYKRYICKYFYEICTFWLFLKSRCLIEFTIHYQV